MATLVATLPPEQLGRLAMLLQGVAASYAGQNAVTVTLNDTPYSVTGPDGIVRKA